MTRSFWIVIQSKEIKYVIFGTTMKFNQFDYFFYFCLPRSSILLPFYKYLGIGSLDLWVYVRTQDGSAS